MAQSGVGVERLSLRGPQVAPRMHLHSVFANLGRFADGALQKASDKPLALGADVLLAEKETVSSLF